jgi:hypothetical protein
MMIQRIIDGWRPSSIVLAMRLQRFLICDFPGLDFVTTFLRNLFKNFYNNKRTFSREDDE